jgi:hypothetical protein
LFFQLRPFFHLFLWSKWSELKKAEIAFKLKNNCPSRLRRLR